MAPTLGLTAHAEHHADRGVADRVPGHTLIATCICRPHVIDGQEPFRADVKFSTFRDLNPVLERSNETAAAMRWGLRRFLGDRGGPVRPWKARGSEGQALLAHSSSAYFTAEYR